MKNGTMGSSRGKGRGQRASEGSSRGMGGGQTTGETSRPPLGKVDRGRGRGSRPDVRRPTLLHTQPLEDMDDISRSALITARRETLRTNTARLCQERWASSRITLDYAPPPPAADQERLPSDMSKAPERTHSPESSAGQAPTQPKTKVRRATARQLKLDAQEINRVDHHHTAEDSWNPIWTEPPSGARLKPVGDTTPGPLKDNLDQSNRVPSTIQGALPFLEPEATTNPPPNMYGFLGQEFVHATGYTLPIPLEASMEPPTQPEEDYTSTSTDNHEWDSPGRKGHIADGSDTGRLKKDYTRTKPKSRTDLLPYVALNQSTSLIDAEEWPQLPGPGAQDLHGPTLQPLAMPRESPADTPMPPPIALHQQVQKQQETAIDSTEQVTISSEETGMPNHGAPESITYETAINVPEAGQPTTATSTLTRRQRSARSNRPPKSSTA